MDQASELEQQQHNAVESAPAVARPLRLLPFHALRLAPGRLGDPSSARVFARPYRQVEGRLISWEKRGQLVRDREPAIHIHEYTSDGLTVRGLVGALDVSHLTTRQTEAAVLPHEGVHRSQVRELADRMAAMSVNPAPILLAHQGPAEVRALINQVTQQPPDASYSDRTDQHHRFWSIRDPETWALLDSALATSRAVIADGHHRYAAYLRLQDAQPGTPWDRGLAMLVDHDDTPLFLGAIHRVLVGADLDKVAAAAAAAGDEGPGAVVTEADQAAVLAALGGTTIALSDGQRWLRVDLPDRGTAVEQLHAEVLPRLRARRKRMQHAHSMREAMAQLAHNPGVVVLLPALDFADVARVAAAGGLLPEKATSFQPKPTVGAIMRSLLDEPSDR